VKILILGASGHGKVVADVIRCQRQFSLVGFLDDDPAKKGTTFDGMPVLGGFGDAGVQLRSGIEAVIVAIGSNKERLARAAELEQLGFKCATAIHPSAVVAQGVTIGSGTVVMAGAVINAGAAVGKNVIVNTSSVIEHDCQIGDGAHISPGAHLAGGVIVGRAAHVGIGSAVIQQVRIGAESVIGAGAVVIRDVPEGVTIVGNPGRVIRDRRGKRIG
jgi:sugar O-acyltransferase (sialic acid O-acetyltransferase NeuD family)